jgi:hypothetical protein
LVQALTFAPASFVEMDQIMGRPISCKSKSSTCGYQK